MNLRYASTGGCALVLAVAVAWLAAALRIETDMSAFLPRGQSDAQRMFNRELRDGVSSRLMLIELAGDQPANLARMSRTLQRKLAVDSAFKYVGNGDSALGGAELAVIERHRYQMSDAVDAAHFDVAALRAALAERLEGLAGGGSLLEKRWLSSDPTGEAWHVLAQLAPPVQPKHIDGVWFNRAGKAALLIAETRAPGWDVERQRQAILALQRDFAMAREDSNAQLRFSSPGAMAAESRTLIAAEATRLSLISVVLILGILLWVYRSLPLVLLCFVPAVTGLLAGIVTVNAWFGSVQGITLGFAATLLGESVDYPSFLLTQRRPGENLFATRARLGRTLAMAVLTTACGALALLFADFPGLAQLGLLTAVGILVAGAMTYWLLPIWIAAPALHSPLPRRPLLALDLPMGRRVRWLAVITMAGVVALSAWNQSWWDDDVANMNPLPVELKVRDRELRQALGAPDVRYLIVVGAQSEEDVLRHAEELRPHLQRWVAAGALGGFELVSDFLPSRATQARRQAALPQGAELSASLGAALAGLPFRDGTFAPFVLAVEEARNAPPLTFADLSGNALGLKATALLRRGDSGGARSEGWEVVIPLRGVANASAMAADVAALGAAQVRWLDLRGESAAMMKAYRHEAVRYAGLGALLIFGVLAFGLRSVRGALRLMFPVALAVLLTAGTLVAARTPLSVLHLVALLLVLGLGVNYALFIARARVEGDEFAQTLRTLAVVSGTTLCAFGTLAFSGIVVLHAIGITVCAGVGYSLLVCFLLLSAKPARDSAMKTR
ncbi:MAG: MMPL family transporter [Betaproteobacteria bacterium]